MRKLLYFTIALVMTGCGGPTFKILANPKSGELVKCEGRGFQGGWIVKVVADCISEYEAIGYVQVENLTPEQRTNLGIADPKQ